MARPTNMLDPKDYSMEALRLDAEEQDRARRIERAKIMEQKVRKDMIRNRIAAEAYYRDKPRYG